MNDFIYLFNIFTLNMSIKTFVFLDSETSGLPAYEHNKTKITELCLISAQAEHISLGVIPRVQNKLALCFNPQKRIQPDAESITGLYNDELINESSFDEVSVNLIVNFLQRLKKPICLVAHNGYRFDYPILRNHIELESTSFPNDILCMDSLRAFREILNKQNTSQTETKEESSDKTIITKEGKDKNESIALTDEWDEILYNEVLKIEESICATQPIKSNSQAFNETTPPVKKQCNVPAAPRHRRIQNSASTSRNAKPPAQRRLDFNESKPKQSFALINVFERLTKKSSTNAHQAEEDVKMLLECAVHLGDEFVEYANEYAIPFNQIPKMEPGVKIGSVP